MWQIIWWWHNPFSWRFGWWPRAYPRRQRVFRYWNFGIFEIRRLQTREEIRLAYEEEGQNATT
jgi:hypothetical protein